MPNVCRLLLVEKSNGLTSVRKDELRFFISVKVTTFSGKRQHYIITILRYYDKSFYKHFTSIKTNTLYILYIIYIKYMLYSFYKIISYKCNNVIM